MSRSRSDDAARRSTAFATLETGRLTWIGLSVAAIGWIGLVAETTFADVLSKKVLPNAAPSLHGDLIIIAICIIGSGFALAIIGALQAGFGALNRFFEAVLMRSAQRSATPEPAQGPVEPSFATTNTGKRPYRINADGSVEVETIVGTRRFDSLAQAREFI